VHTEQCALSTSTADVQVLTKSTDGCYN